MKLVILAGGLGTRLSEKTDLMPKPMVEIGGRPILWHIMKIYENHGITDFIVCCGYRGNIIKEYFMNYIGHMSDITVNLKENVVEIHKNVVEPWTVTLVNTGDTTMTGGRMRKVKEYLNGEAAFCMTYGDGVANVDIAKLIQFHKAHSRLATVTVSRQPARYGVLQFGEGDVVTDFREKPANSGDWVNSGFFVLATEVLNSIEDDDVVWEEGPMRVLAEKRELYAFKHEGFWQPMDTLRENRYLNDLWSSNCAPWKTW